MHKRIGGAFLLVALLLGLAPAFARAAGARAPQTPGKFALFVVSREGARGEFQVVPIAFFDGRGAFEEPVTAGNEQNVLTAFFERYYKPGARYRFVYGGAEAGTVTIREAVRGECAPVAARAVVSSNVKLGRDALALATDATQGLRARGSRRAPTLSERAGVLRLAKSIFKQNRVSAAAVNRSTTALDLTATDLDGDGREELVGTFLVKSGPKVRDELFLVAAPRADGFSPLLQKHERLNAREMMDPSLIGEVGKGGFLAEMFIDQLDADGDGVTELFTAATSFEGTTYRAYRRAGSEWRAVYEHYSYRCGY